MTRKLSSILAVVTLAFSLAACGAPAQTRPEPAEPAATSAEQPASASQEPATAPDPGAETPIACPSTSGALHVEGTQLTDEHGDPVVLRGISTHGIAWFPEYVNAAMFQQLADWGANVVRLALYTSEYGGWCEGGNQEQLRQLVLDAANYAHDADLYLIVDWHTLSDNDPNQHAPEAQAFFADIAANLAHFNNVIYEVCNEPNGATSWADVKRYAEAVIPVVRDAAPDAVCLVGTPEWCQRPDEAAADPLPFENVMYTVHFYAATHKQDLRDRTKAAQAAGLPIFVSEFGICDASGNGAIEEAEATAWLSLLDDLGISRVMWNLSNKDETSAMIRAGVAKTSDLADEDLSQAGLWAKNVLLAGVAAPASQGAADGATVPPASAEPAAQPESHTAGDLSYTLQAVNSWPNNGKTTYQFDLALTNNGPATNGWQLTLEFDQPIELVDGWNGSYEASGTTLTITNASYNANLAPGTTQTDIGFQLTAATEPKLKD